MAKVVETTGIHVGWWAGAEQQDTEYPGGDAVGEVCVRSHAAWAGVEMPGRQRFGAAPSGGLPKSSHGCPNVSE